MKKHCPIFLLLYLSFLQLNAQKIELRAVNGVHSDMVTIGFDENASIGIDEELGEHSIEEIVEEPIDMRVYQRDSAHFSCLYSGVPDYSPITFSENFDSKINLRHPDNSNNARFFEIKTNSDIVTDILLSSSSDITAIIEKFLVTSDTCNIVQSEVNIINNGVPFNNYHIQTNLPIYSFTIVFRESVLSSINEQEFSEHSELIISPNPFNDILKIECNHIRKGEIIVYDIMGNKVYKTNFYTGMEIDLDSLSSGFYFVKVFDNQSNLNLVKKVMKVGY